MKCPNCGKEIAGNSLFCENKSMKKCVCSILVLIVVSFVCMSWSPIENHYTGWDLYGLKGKVKELHIKLYNMHVPNGMAIPYSDEVHSEDIYFSEDGRIDSTISMPIRWKHIYTYSEDTVICDQYYENSASFSNKEISVYDKDGKIVEKILYDSDMTVYQKKIFSYDAKQRIASCLSVDGSDYEHEQIKDFTFNPRGLVTSCNHYRWYGENPHFLDYKIYYKYDKQGNTIMRKKKDRTGRIDFVQKMEYNKNGCCSAIWYDDELACTCEYEYDENGNYVVCRTTYTEGSNQNKVETKVRTIVYY